MSNREKAIQLINQIPESKLIFVIGMLDNVKEMLSDETTPDAWDLQMIAEAKAENNGGALSLDEMLKKDGLSYADL